jgi:hypothetical protein
LQQQFDRELSNCIPPVSNFLFLVAVLKIFRNSKRRLQQQFDQELSDYIPPASNFLFLVAVLKKIAT